MDHFDYIKYQIKVNLVSNLHFCSFAWKKLHFFAVYLLENSPKFPGESPGNDFYSPIPRGRKILPEMETLHLGQKSTVLQLFENGLHRGDRGDPPQILAYPDHFTKKKYF